MLRYWPRLSREAMDAPSLAVFKARLDGALSNLVWWKVSLPRAEGLDYTIFECHSLPKPFHDSVIHMPSSHHTKIVWPTLASAGKSHPRTRS